MKKIMMILMMFVFAVSCAKTDNQITIKGSDTEVNLVSDFAEAYMKINKKVKIAVTGGGSGTGIAALLNNQVDIANASRLIKSKEIAKAKAKGINPVQVVIATDGLSVIINPANKVKDLTIGQIAAIFKGEIKNWKEVGGADKKITCYGRQSNSGTFAYFKKKVLKKKDFSADVNRMNGNAQIVVSVKKDESGIGYVGIGYITGKDGKFVPGIKVISVAKKQGSPYIAPAKNSIMSGLYPLTRPLNQYLNGKPKGKILKFLRFCLFTKEGTEIVKNSGFFPVQVKDQRINAAAGLSR
ncbi:MAG: PstS family phosphate ABC transporter substrate-binding protein [Spirochaetes bacterium]|nr:PstS family phosphate ABC transporter substrate-binding protein [Spirochaetota bacterium]